MNNKTYKINSIDYKLKERYSSKDWGKLLLILNPLELKEESGFGMIAQLLAGGILEELLNVILTGEKPIEEVYDDDFKDSTLAINDFFALKKSLMQSTAESSKE